MLVGFVEQMYISHNITPTTWTNLSLGYNPAAPCVPCCNVIYSTRSTPWPVTGLWDHRASYLHIQDSSLPANLNRAQEPSRWPSSHRGVIRAHLNKSTLFRQWPVVVGHPCCILLWINPQFRRAYSEVITKYPEEKSGQTSNTISANVYYQWHVYIHESSWLLKHENDYIMLWYIHWACSPMKDLIGQK